MELISDDSIPAQSIATISNDERVEMMCGTRSVFYLLWMMIQQAKGLEKRHCKHFDWPLSVKSGPLLQLYQVDSG
jgi:hypothetical protein